MDKVNIHVHHKVHNLLRCGFKLKSSLNKNADIGKIIDNFDNGVENKF